MYYLSEKDLKDLWTNAWLLSKGYDKDIGKTEAIYREETFYEYVNKLTKEETNMDKRFVILGDVVNPITSNPEEEDETNKEEEENK